MLSLVAAAGCARPAGPAADGGAGLSGAAADAGPAQATPEVTFSLVAHLPDAGVQAVPSGADVRAVIEPVSRLELRSDIGLRNYRIRLFDEADRAVVSDDTAEESDAGVVYRIELPAPLSTGHGYALVVDAESDGELKDLLGRPVPEQRFEFQVAGEKVRPPPPERRRRR